MVIAMRKWMALGIMAMLALCGCASGCAAADTDTEAGKSAGDSPEAGVILVTAFEPFGGETLNPTALNFWGKHFDHYTYSFARRIDERIGG